MSVPDELKEKISSLQLREGATCVFYRFDFSYTFIAYNAQIVRTDNPFAEMLPRYTLQEILRILGSMGSMIASNRTCACTLGLRRSDSVW